MLGGLVTVIDGSPQGGGGGVAEGSTSSQGTERTTILFCVLGGNVASGVSFVGEGDDPVSITGTTRRVGIERGRERERARDGKSGKM